MSKKEMPAGRKETAEQEAAREAAGASLDTVFCPPTNAATVARYRARAAAAERDGTIGLPPAYWSGMDRRAQQYADWLAWLDEHDPDEARRIDSEPSYLERHKAKTEARKKQPDKPPVGALPHEMDDAAMLRRMYKENREGGFYPLMRRYEQEGNAKMYGLAKEVLESAQAQKRNRPLSRNQ